MLTAEYLRALLNYEPETGVFRWRRHIRGGAGERRAGGIAGGIGTRGYWCIGIDNRRHRAHCLAWLYMTGDWPEHEIDHINRNRADNRWANLRDVTHAENMRNATPSSEWKRREPVCVLR